MSFSTGKCKVMHISNKNTNFKYKIPDQELYDIKQEKDLSNNLKMSDECTAASKKANMMSDQISRNFYHKYP